MEIDLGRAIPLPILEVQEMEAKGMPIELVLCPLCGVEPVREQQEVMLGKIQDGGYPVLQESLGSQERLASQHCGMESTRKNGGTA